MSSHNQSTEQRHHVRYRLKDNFFAAIQGEYFNNPACIVDLNRNGVGFYSVCEESELTGKFIVLDLISDRNRAILLSLRSQVVFTCVTSQHKNDPNDAPKRYGVQFVNLSALEKRQLDLITKKYALPE
jgi:hypothetical protein